MTQYRESAYYPDLVMFDEKIIIEIDGGYHDEENQLSFDEYRDNVFCANDFIANIAIFTELCIILSP